jgi:integrase
MSLLSRQVSLVREWVADLPLQPNTALLLMDTVRAIFEAAVDDRIIPRNPLKADSVRRARPRHVRGEVAAWTLGQVTAVSGHLPERLRAMAWLGACTGMRQGELFGLSVDNVDFLRRAIRVDAQVVQLGSGLVFGPVKNRKPRTVPVSRHVVPLLARHVEQFPPAAVTLPWSQRKDKRDGKPETRRLLFTDGHGGAWRKQTVNRRWRAGWQSAGVPDAGRANGMHVLRHTAASTWLSHGLNPAKVADWLGDTVAMVLKTYAHYLPHDDELGRSIMDEFLAPQAPKRPENALSGG